MARKNLKVVSRVIPSFLRPPNSFTFSLSGFPVLVLKNSNVDFVIVVVPKISRFLAFGFFWLLLSIHVLQTGVQLVDA